MITACPSVRQELKPCGKSLAVVRVIGLAAPAARQLGGERGVDEPGDGHGVRDWDSCFSAPNALASSVPLIWAERELGREHCSYRRFGR